MQDTKRSEWIAYLRSLNDRYLNRRTSSGFQVWTVLAFMVICVSRVLQIVPHAVVDTQFRSDLLKVTCLELSGTVVAAFVVLSGPAATVYLARHLSGHVHAVTPLGAAQDYVRGYGLSAAFLICFCLYAVTSWVTETHWSSFVFEWAFFTASVYCVQWAIRSQRRAVRGAQSVSSWAFVGNRFWIWIRVLVIVSAVIFWILAYRSSNVHALESNGVNLLAAGLAFVGIPIDLAALALVVADSMRDSWLEKFETDVLLENVSADEVRSSLIDGYLGKDLTVSLDLLNQSWSDGITRCLSALEGLTKDYVYMGALDVQDASFPEKLAHNVEFAKTLPDYLNGTVNPAFDNLKTVLDRLTELVHLEGIATTLEMAAHVRKVIDSGEKSYAKITALLKGSMLGMFSDLCATAAKANVGEEMERVVEPIRHQLEQL